jgi:hypothetical protein
MATSLYASEAATYVPKVTVDRESEEAWEGFA